MNAEEGGGGAGEEDACLVDGGVGWVEGAVGGERGCGREGEEEDRMDALVDGVFCYVDEEEREHAGGVEVSVLRWGG